MGRKTVSNYLYPEDQPSSSASSLQVASSEHKDTEHAGTVSLLLLIFPYILSDMFDNIHIIVYDVITKKNILHFRAHSQPLSVLRFDPSGTIVSTN